jgi:phytoene desaturase
MEIVIIHSYLTGKKREWNIPWDYSFIILEQKKIYENVEHHTIKFGNKYKEHLDDIFDKKKLNNDISYYLHRPSATDKSMAPEGNDCFYVLVPVPNNQSGIDWKIEGEKNEEVDYR